MSVKATEGCPFYNHASNPLLSSAYILVAGSIAELVNLTMCESALGFSGPGYLNNNGARLRESSAARGIMLTLGIKTTYCPSGHSLGRSRYGVSDSLKPDQVVTSGDNVEGVDSYQGSAS